MKRAALAALPAALLASCAASTAQPTTRPLEQVEWITGTTPNGESYSFTTGCLDGNRVFLRHNSIAAIGPDPTCTIGPIR